MRSRPDLPRLSSPLFAWTREGRLLGQSRRIANAFNHISFISTSHPLKLSSKPCTERLGFRPLAFHLSRSKGGTKHVTYVNMTLVNFSTVINHWSFDCNERLIKPWLIKPWIRKWLFRNFHWTLRSYTKSYQPTSSRYSCERDVGRTRVIEMNIYYKIWHRPELSLIRWTESRIENVPKLRWS